MALFVIGTVISSLIKGDSSAALRSVFFDTPIALFFWFLQSQLLDSDYGFKSDYSLLLFVGSGRH